MDITRHDTTLQALTTELLYADHKYPGQKTETLCLTELTAKLDRLKAAIGSTHDHDQREQISRALLHIAAIAIKQITDGDLPDCNRKRIDADLPALPVDPSEDTEILLLPASPLDAPPPAGTNDKAPDQVKP